MTGFALANAIDGNHTAGGGTTGGGNGTTGDGGQALIDLSANNQTGPGMNQEQVNGNHHFAPVNDNSSDRSRGENQFIFKD